MEREKYPTTSHLLQAQNENSSYQNSRLILTEFHYHKSASKRFIITTN
jgi:hypothetical protein